MTPRKDFLRCKISDIGGYVQALTSISVVGGCMLVCTGTHHYKRRRWVVCQSVGVPTSCLSSVVQVCIRHHFTVASSGCSNRVHTNSKYTYTMDAIYEATTGSHACARPCLHPDLCTERKKCVPLF